MLDAAPRDVRQDDSDARAKAVPPDPSALYITHWAEAYFAPAIIVKLDMTIVWMNAGGRALLSKAEQFCLSGDRLSCVDKVRTGDLKSFLQDLGGSPDVWACPTESGTHLLVRAEKVRPREAEPAAALLFVPADTAPDRFIWADLGEVFGLTRAEAAIVKRFIGGERADEMAQALGVTIETVRTHIRRIYNKLGISSREQLFSLISPYRLR